MQDEFREDLLFWVETDPGTAARLLRIVEETLRNPSTGLGKPEPLKHNPGFWSRRLTGEHRIVYRVAPDLVQARFHY